MVGFILKVTNSYLCQ